MDELTLAEFLMHGAEKAATVEIPGGHCEVYRSECGWLVHVEQSTQHHRWIPCSSRRDLLWVLRQNLGSGPFAELSWKLVGKVF